MQYINAVVLGVDLSPTASQINKGTGTVSDQTVFDRVVAASQKERPRWKPKTRLDRMLEKKKHWTAIPKPLPGEPWLGPVPMWWDEIAHEAGAGDVVTRLWHRAVVEKSGTFRFNATLEAEGLGISRATLARRLIAMEKAKLVKLNNWGGTYVAWVTLLPTPKEKK